jgi:hypothetical protein
LACLIHRLCDTSGYQTAEYEEDRQLLFNALSEEIDRLGANHRQMELSMSRDVTEPSEWLQYFYWCHIVDHLQPFKAVVVRVDPFGQISAVGEPKPARIYGARQVEHGVILACGWKWASGSVYIPNIECVNSFGVYFADQRILSSSLMKGWSAQQINALAPVEVKDYYWGIECKTE